MSHKIELRNFGDGWKSMTLNRRFVGKFRVFEGMEPPVLALAYIGVMEEMPEYSRLGYFADILKAQRAIVARHFQLIEQGRFKPFRLPRP